MVLESSSPRVSGIFHSHHNPIASSLGCKIFKDEFVITLHITNVYRRARPDSVYENTKIWGKYHTIQRIIQYFVITSSRQKGDGFVKMKYSIWIPSLNIILRISFMLSL